MFAYTPPAKQTSNPSLKPFVVGREAAEFLWETGIPYVEGKYAGSEYTLTGNGHGVYWCEDGGSFAYVDEVDLNGDFTFTARIKSAQIPEGGVSHVGILVKGRLGHLEPALSLRWDTYWAKTTGSGLGWFNRITPTHSQIGGKNSGQRGCHGSGQGCIGQGLENTIGDYPAVEGLWMRVTRKRLANGTSAYKLFSRKSESDPWQEHESVAGTHNACGNEPSLHFAPNMRLPNFMIPEDHDGKVLVGLYVANSAGGKERVTATFDNISVEGQGMQEPPKPLSREFSQNAQWWPSYFGPNGNFTLNDEDVEFVETLRNARLLWKSDFVPPAFAQSKRKGLKAHGYKKGGGASLIAADNKVFAYYQTPIPEDDYWAANGNDIVHAFDAVTGKTLWKKTTGKGTYYDPKFDAKSRNIINHTPCWFDGNVYSVSPSGRVNCLNASSGDVKWSANIGGRAQTSALVPIGGAIVTGVGGRRNAPFSVDVVALDAKNGDILWRCKKCAGGGATPTPWEFEGKHYVIVANNDGEARCLNARTGEEKWKLTGLGQNEYTVHVSGSYMALFADSIIHKVGGRVAGFRITDTKATSLWTLPEELRLRIVMAIYKGYLYGFHKDRHYRVIDMETGKLVGQTLPKAGLQNIHKTGLGAGSPVVAVNNRLIANLDSEHAHHYVMHKTFPETFAPTDESCWWPYHELTATYSECHATMKQPVVEGRFFTRGKDGVYCYDLRKLYKSSSGQVIHLRPKQAGFQFAPPPLVYDIQGRIMGRFGSPNSFSKTVFPWFTGNQEHLYLPGSNRK